MHIDAHQHFWDLSRPFDYAWLDAPELAAIRRDFLPEHLSPLLNAAGVDGCVAVQTQHDVAETRWLLDLADAHPFIAGVVGWVDLTEHGCGDQLDEFTPHPKFVGVRHVVQDEPDDDWVVRPDVLRGLRELERRGLPFDLLFFPRHLKHAATLARTLPGLPLVIDHLGKPPIAAGELDAWAADLRAAAAFDTVSCKLSGMVTEADWNAWTPADLRPYVEVALDAFGPDRCLYGSDWPVCVTAGSYGRVHAALVEVLDSLGVTGDDRAGLLGGTAVRVYGLRETAPAQPPVGDG